ncbi:nucleotidyltransferase domain-containing protein [Ferdinandcohnia sp. Marseille-Q9671]
MKEHIVEILQQIEKEYDIKILYACEAGSRTWGISSDSSDYDIRFIYIHKIDWYLSIDHKRDVLEFPKEDQLNIPIQSLVDASGWELTKALRLFRKSNPALLEWLHSSIVYYQESSLLENIQKLEPIVFSPVPCIYHYAKMAKANFKRIQEKGADIKTYINVIRPLLVATYIMKNHKVDTLNVHSLIETLLPESELKTSIQTVLEMKSNKEMIHNRIPIIDQFIEEQIDHLEKYVSAIEPAIENPTNKLDQLFRDTLYEVWG